MIASQNQKFVSVTPPAAIIDNASATTNVVDTLGFDYLDLYVYFGAMDIAVTALKIQESDAQTNATTLTSGADVTGLIYGTSTNSAGTTSTLPSATDDNTAYVFRVDLRARKRYVKPTVTLGDGAAGTFVTAFALLSRAEVSPSTAATRGVNQELIV